MNDFYCVVEYFIDFFSVFYGLKERFIDSNLGVVLAWFMMWALVEMWRLKDAKWLKWTKTVKYGKHTDTEIHVLFNYLRKFDEQISPKEYGTLLKIESMKFDTRQWLSIIVSFCT